MGSIWEKEEKRWKASVDKQKRRATLGVNVKRGAWGENIVRGQLEFGGNRVIRSPRGKDFEVTTQTGKKYLVEVKTGNAKKSKLQERLSKKNKGCYRVIRPL